MRVHCNYFSDSEKFSEVFKVAIKDGSDLISLVIVSKDAPLFQALLKLVKDESIKKILNQRQMENLNVTRQSNLIFTTKDTLTAQELLKIDSFLLYFWVFRSIFLYSPKLLRLTSCLY